MILYNIIITFIQFNEMIIKYFTTNNLIYNNKIYVYTARILPS